MTESEISEMIQKQRAFFQTGATVPLSFRREALTKLRAWITGHTDEISDALKEDLGKSGQESYMCEIGLVVSEITYMLKHLGSFAKEHVVATPLVQFASRSFTKAVPRGTVLIMSPWNYPFLLSVDPLVDAIAAGNTCLLKPSAYSPATTRILLKMTAECFSFEHVALVTGGRAENTALLRQKFNYIFFTGSQAVGKEVLKNAAENLTPVTLELGGKSPCIIDETAKIPLAARRIVFGKFLNCGQTCVAPDYFYCQESIKDALLAAIIKEIKRQFGERPLENNDYGKIISEKHFSRICTLMNPKKIVFGGKKDAVSLRIEPTVMDGVTWDDAVMKEEIFGPIIPILTYKTLPELIRILNDQPYPLAGYYFSSTGSNIRYFTSRCSFGGGCINDTIIHLATSRMAFGGVGESGMGAYHGKKGFDTFSHQKSIVDKKTWMDLPMRYQPYRTLNDKLIKMFLR